MLKVIQRVADWPGHYKEMIHLRVASRASFLQIYTGGGSVLGEFDMRGAIYCLFPASVWRLINEALMELLITDRSTPAPPFSF